MLRLIAAVPTASIGTQTNLTFLKHGSGNFPSGHLPIDDVIDAEILAALGALTADHLKSSGA